MKRNNILIILLILVIFSFSVKADLMSSPNYNITSISVSSGGENTSSDSYKQNTILGTITGFLSSLYYKFFLGFFYDSIPVSYDLSSCQDLTDEDTIYTLVDNVSSTGTCFNILADDITLDCDGHTINYSNTSAGQGVSNSGYDDFTLKDCNINLANPALTYSYGVYVFNGAINNSIINTNITSYTNTGTNTYNYGIYFNNAVYSLIENCSINTSGDGYNGRANYPIYFYLGNNNTARNNNLSSNCYVCHGIISRSSDHNLLNNSVSTFFSGSYGIYLYGADNNEVYNNSVITYEDDAGGDSSFGIYLFNGADNNILKENNVVSYQAPSYIANAGYGTDLDSSNLAEGLPVLFNDSLSNYAFENMDLSSYGQIVCAGCDNVSYNNVTIRNDGLLFGGSNNGGVTDSDIIGNTSPGLYLFYNSDNNVINNTNISSLSSYINPVKVRPYSDSNTFDSCRINGSSNDYSIYLQTSDYNKFINNNIESKSYYTILFYGGTDYNNFSNNLINSSSYCFYLDSSTYTENYFEENILDSSGSYVLYSNRGSNQYLFSDNDFTNNGIYFAAASNHTLNLTNTTSLGTRTFAAGSTAKLNVFWYLDIHVNDSSGDLENANVTAWDKYITQYFSELTNASGWITRKTLQEYFQNSTESYYYTNYTINTTKDTYSPDSRELNLTSNNVLNITLSKGNLTVSLDSPLDYWNINDTGVFECSATNTVGLQNVTLYHNYSGSFVANESLSVSSTSASANWTVKGFSEEKGFIWNCYACDDNNYCLFASANRTLNVDLTKPNISFTDPTPINNTRKSTSDNYAFVNVSVSDASNNISSFIDWNRSLVGWWRLEQGNGTFFVDSSSYSNDGTCTGSACPTLTTGMRGKAYKFDGADDYVDIPNINIEDFNWTVSLWANHEGETYKQGLLGGYTLHANYNDFCSYDGVSYKCVNDVINLNEWAHLSLVCNLNSNILTFYKNGINLSSQSYNCSYGDNRVSIIGSYSASGYYFNGTIDEVQIFNRALSPEEINASYQTGLYKLYNNFTDLSSGNYTYTSYAVDQAGNLNETEERTFKVNYAPEVSNVVLSSMSGNNLTTDNLTVTFTSTDSDSDDLTNITDWRKDGTSIAVLNMPFNTNITSTASGVVKDYSTYGNNGTLASGSSTPIWTSSGKIGGSYNFDGVNDYISITDATTFNSTEWSVTAWTKLGLGDYQTLLSFNNGGLPVVRLSHGTYPLLYLNSGADDYYRYGNLDIKDDQWHHVAFLFRDSDNYVKIYIDGIDRTGSGPNGNEANVTSTWRIGGSTLTANGSIDELQVYNYSLTIEQVTASYQAGLANHSVQTIVNNETTKGDTWSVAVTPNDVYEDGTTTISNDLIIENGAPSQVTLVSPEDGNTSIERKPTFIWNNATDPDGDGVTYDLQVDDDTGFGADSDINQSGLSSTNYTVIGHYKLDLDVTYYWHARACDDYDACGDWSDVWNFTVNSYNDMILLNDTTDFGMVTRGQTYNTTDDDPFPFVLQNDGNMLINISLNSTQLFLVEELPGESYKSKIDNTSSESGSFDWANSLTSWFNMPSITTFAITHLKYEDVTDTAEIDVLITPPMDELAGPKSAEIIFTGEPAE